jgi:hypothetical protein
MQACSFLSKDNVFFCFKSRDKYVAEDYAWFMYINERQRQAIDHTIFSLEPKQTTFQIDANRLLCNNYFSSCWLPDCKRHQNQPIHGGGGAAVIVKGQYQI